MSLFEENWTLPPSPPPPALRLGLGFRFGLGLVFGAIFIGCNCPRTLLNLLYPNFCYDEMVFSCNMFANVFLLLFLFSAKHNIFIIKKEKKLIFKIHQVRCFEVFSSSLRLLLKVWIWLRWQSRWRFKIVHHDGEQLGIYQKVGCYFNLYIARNEEFQFIWQKMYSGQRQMPYSKWRQLT